MSAMGYCNKHFTGYVLSTGCLDCKAVAAPAPLSVLSGATKIAHLKDAYRATDTYHVAAMHLGGLSAKLDLISVDGQRVEVTHERVAAQRLCLGVVQTGMLYQFKSIFEIDYMTATHLPLQFWIERRTGTCSFVGKPLTRWSRNDGYGEQYMMSINWIEEEDVASQLEEDCTYLFDEHTLSLDPSTKMERAMFVQDPWKAPAQVHVKA